MSGKLTKSGIKAFLAPIVWIIITGLVFFLASGEINNLRVWIYIGVYAIGGLITGVIGMIFVACSTKIVRHSRKRKLVLAKINVEYHRN